MAAHDRLTAAHIDFDAAGSPYAPDFDDVYHSAAGGPEQSSAVFLAGNGLPQRWRRRTRFTILETGFGLGLNFLCTGTEMLADPDAPDALHYVGVEKHPPRGSDLARAHAVWPQFAALSAELRRTWPLPLSGYHRIELASGRIVLTLLFGEAEEMLAELQASVDAIFLDGFAPAKNPAMWSEALFRQIRRLSVLGTTAATWTVAGTVRSYLQGAGFAVTRQPGYEPKRERLVAVLETAGSAGSRHYKGATRHAAVIGAGLAGSWICHALGRRGWTVDLIERQSEAGCGASANPAAVLRPAFNVADNANARLARAGFLHTVRTLANDERWHALHVRTGLLHVASTAAQIERMAKIIERGSFPDEYAVWVDAHEAGRLAGRSVGGPAWWIPHAGWVRTRQLCAALLAGVEDRISRRFGQAADRILPTGGGWRVCDSRERPLAEAPIVLIASGYESARLGIGSMPTLIPVRGQVTYLPPSLERPLKTIVAGDGYVAPLPDGGHWIGATFEPDSSDAALRSDDHARNLARAAGLLPGFACSVDPRSLEGWAGIRTATADRLPLCGPLRETADGALYLCTGLGARGAVLAPLCAEILAARLHGEPHPLEASLIAAIDPRRPL